MDLLLDSEPHGDPMTVTSKLALALLSWLNTCNRVNNATACPFGGCLGCHASSGPFGDPPYKILARNSFVGFKS